MQKLFVTLNITINIRVQNFEPVYKGGNMYPTELKYTETHEYVRQEDNIVTVGISKYALEHLGDIVFLDIPKVGDEIKKGKPCGTIESVKAVEEMYAPINGKVTEVNNNVLNDPITIAENPYETGWLFKAEASDISELDSLLNSEEYESKLDH